MTNESLFSFKKMQDVMKKMSWVINGWKPHILEESILILDIHKAQNTEKVKP